MGWMIIVILSDMYSAIFKMINSRFSTKVSTASFCYNSLELQYFYHLEFYRLFSGSSRYWSFKQYLSFYLILTIRLTSWKVCAAPMGRARRLPVSQMPRMTSLTTQHQGYTLYSAQYCILSPGLSFARLLGQGVDDGLVPVQADCHQCPYAGVNLSNKCKVLPGSFESVPYSKF